MFTPTQLCWIWDTADFMSDAFMEEIRDPETTPEDRDLAIAALWLPNSILDDYPNGLPHDYNPPQVVREWLYGVCHITAEMLREAIPVAQDTNELRDMSDDLDICVSIRRSLFTVH